MVADTSKVKSINAGPRIQLKDRTLWVKEPLQVRISLLSHGLQYWIRNVFVVVLRGLL
jgi:hypothetical protein